MHVAIIMDGNRKYALKHNLLPIFKGHEPGKKTLEKLLVHWARKSKVEYLTLYTLSLDNFHKRGTIERNFILKLLQRGFDNLAEHEVVHEQKINIKIIGERKILPKYLKDSIKNLENKTKDYKNKFLTLCVAYDGQQEIINACKKTKSATIRTFKKYLQTKDVPSLDLLIRTGGEKRISGFLLWDVSYAELIFRKQLWPEYTPQMFEADLKEFKRRKRRFGK